MPGFDDIFATLRRVTAAHLDRLTAQTDTGAEYTLVGRKPSPFPQR